MKVSAIPPLGALKYAKLGSTRYHLALAREVLSVPAIRDTYRQLSDQGEHVFLDNSAHELGTGLNVSALLQAADAIQAKEIVLPDRLFFGDDTLWLSRQAAQVIRESQFTGQLMGVPQGRTIHEWRKCLNGLIDLGVEVIGISKDYETWEGGLRHLILDVQTMFPAVRVHLLGWGRDAAQLYQLSHDPSITCVRGVDSTKPFVYALAGIRIPYPVASDESSWRVPEYPRRLSSYFRTAWTPGAEKLIGHNLHAFHLFANA